MSSVESIGPQGGLQTLAARIRKVYILTVRDYRQRQTGAACDYGVNRLPAYDDRGRARGIAGEPVWYRLARFALENGVSADTLVHATFHHFRGIGANDPPVPQALIAPQAAGRLVGYVAGRAREAERLLRLEHHTFRVETLLTAELDKVDVNEAARRVLHDPSVHLSSLYRHCMALRGGATDVAARFAAEAFVEYLPDREGFDAGWGDMIPAGLKETAARFYDTR